MNGTFLKWCHLYGWSCYLNELIASLKSIVFLKSLAVNLILIYKFIYIQFFFNWDWDFKYFIYLFNNIKRPAVAQRHNCLDTREKKWKHTFKLIFHFLEWESNLQRSRYSHTLVPPTIPVVRVTSASSTMPLVTHNSSCDVTGLATDKG